MYMLPMPWNLPVDSVPKYLTYSSQPVKASIITLYIKRSIIVIAAIARMAVIIPTDNTKRTSCTVRKNADSSVDKTGLPPNDHRDSKPINGYLVPAS
jgi:hypothetical protein